MNFLRKCTYSVLGLATIFACSDDNDATTIEPTDNTVTISEVAFTTSEENGTGTEIGVTPTSVGGTSYLIDFGDPAASGDADVLSSTGDKVSYTYPETTATYTINVTASAENAVDVSTEKTITITHDTAAGPCTSETTESLSAADFNMTFFTDQTANIITDNVTFEMATNPDAENAINSSCNVAKVTKSNVNPWDNLQIDFDSQLQFIDHSGLSLKVYSSVPGFKVLVKLESLSNPANSIEKEIATTKTEEWENLEFAFSSSDSNKYDKIVLIFDLASASNNTYYFDDFTYYGTGDGGSAVGGSDGVFSTSSGINFESDGFGANWSWNIFENDDNPALIFVNNPNASGINTSSTVAQITARQTGAPWVGTENVHGQMGITWDLNASNAIIKMMVYKTVISNVGIKLATPSGGAQGEILVANTKINEWEELTFDFSSRIGNGLDGSTNIDQIIIFPDFNTDGRTSDTVTYFDNITFSAQ